MFEVNGEYANRRGKYTVLAIEEPKLHVRYEDGTYAELNMNIQGRIWQNILAEQEAEQAKVSRSAHKQDGNESGNRYFLKSVSLPSADELMFPGWQERVVLAMNPIQASRINAGDRIIYYAIETDTFFAVATITGEGFKADPKEYFYRITGQEMHFFPVDIDVSAFQPDKGIARESIELDEHPELKKRLSQPEMLYGIGEDDFELIAELLTELSETENNGIDDEDFEEDGEE